MHRRWMSLPLLSSYVSAFYPRNVAVQDDTAVGVKYPPQARRFVPYAPASSPEQHDGTVKMDLTAVERRANSFTVLTSSKPSDPNALAVNQDGADIAYFSTLQFGSKGQNMYMLLDTGSANTWVMGSTCSSRACAIHNTLGPANSNTLSVSKTGWSVAYGTGEVDGLIATDTVTVASFTLNMGFGLANTTSDDFNSYPMDGILGLGRVKQPSTVTPAVMDALAGSGKLKSKVVGIHLARAGDANDGEILFGGADTAKYTGPITYTSTGDADGWEIPVDDAFVGSTACKFTGKSAIVDTGTSYIMMPSNDAATLHKLIPGSSQNGESFTVPCSSTANVQFAFSGAKWSVSPKDYVGGPAGSNGACSSKIVGHQAFGPNQWILGATFLKNVYAVFDYAQTQIGFAQLAAGNSAGSSSVAASGSVTSSPTGSSVSPSVSSVSGGASATSAAPAIMSGLGPALGPSSASASASASKSSASQTASGTAAAAASTTPDNNSKPAHSGAASALSSPAHTVLATLSAMLLAFALGLIA